MSLWRLCPKRICHQSMSSSQSLLKAGQKSVKRNSLGYTLLRKRPTQVMPFLIDIEEFHIEFVGSKQHRVGCECYWVGRTRIGAKYSECHMRFCYHQFIIEWWNIGGSQRNISCKRRSLRNPRWGKRADQRNPECLYNSDFEAELMNCERILTTDGTGSLICTLMAWIQE